MNGKWIYLAQRNARLDRAQFVQRWLRHRKLGAKPAMAAEFLTADYAAVRTDLAGEDGVSDEYDAVGLFALRGLSSIPTVSKFLQQDFAQADELRFFTMTSDRFSMFCAEKVLRDGAPTKHVLVQFLRRAEDVSPFDFERRWEDQAPSVFGQSGLARYIQNVVVAPPPPGFGYDGIAELWFADADSMKAAARTFAQALPNAGFPNAGFIDPRNSFCVATDIIMSRSPPPPAV